MLGVELGPMVTQTDSLPETLFAVVGPGLVAGAAGVAAAGGVLRMVVRLFRRAL